MLAYRINTSSTNSTYESLYYVQTANIDLSLHYWDAIGTFTSSSNYLAFSGHYDGGNFTISGLYTEAGSGSSYSYQGLFGYVRGQSKIDKAIIKNLGIIDSNIQGYRYVGGVVGEAYYSTVTNCYNTGAVDGSDYVGGVVGYANYSTVTNCYNTGSVSGSGGYVSGIVGNTYSSSVTNCYSTGVVTGNSSYVGGVVGYTNSSAVTNCYNTGNITGDGVRVGGVAGYVSSSAVTNCYNTGNITGGSNVGGVVGYVSSYVTITNCYNTGTVTGSEYVGGVVGYVYYSSTVTNCYNAGAVDGDSYTGGVVGYVDYSSTVTNCYYGGNCTLSYGIGSSSSNTGASKDENLIANAKSLSWYQNRFKWHGGYLWNFDDIWQIDSNKNNGYPYLSDSSYSALYPNDLSQYWTNAGNYADSFAGGSGSESDPYQIATPEQLARLAYLINSSSTNSTYKSLYYVQTANLDMSEYWWDAIGTYTSSSDYLAFSGQYDGGEYTISGLYTEAGSDLTYSYQGLFGYVGGQSNTNKATIKNVGIIDSNIQGYGSVGGVAGYASSSTFTNCYNTGSVTGSGSSVGGVVGYAYYTSIHDCYNAGDVLRNSNPSTCYIGGVVGFMQGSTIANCYNAGSVNGVANDDGRVFAGGVVGFAENNNTITNCYNTGFVYEEGDSSCAGGVVGFAEEDNAITNCYNTSAVTGTGIVGGVVGWAERSNKVTDCYNTGDVSGIDTNDSVGGVLGVSGFFSYDYRSDVINCYNIGAVTGTGEIGGVVGCAYKYCGIINCYNIGAVTGTGEVGGVVGYAYSSTITNNYYGGNCTLSYGIGSSSSNTGASKDKNLIANAKSLRWYQDSYNWNSNSPWDFENVWTFVDGVNDGYPVLRGFSTKITYNSNSQPEEVVSESFSVGTTIVLAEADLFEREGYSVSSWNTMADGSGDSFAPGATYTGSSVTLYAQWEAKIIQVNLEENGGAGGTSAIYLKYDSGWYSSSSCTSSSKITALPSTPTRTGYEFKGYSTEPDGSGTLAVSATGAINVSDTFYSTDGTRTWYAVWEARNPAYYDSEGGYWYVENGKLPQSKVGESLKATLSGQWSSLSDGSVYYMGVEELANGDLTTDGGMQSKVYDGEEYVKFNGEFYLVKPIRWRLVYSAEQDEGYAVENTSVLATMAEIVFVGSYSSTKIGVGAGYSAESVTMLLKNQVSTEFLVGESREVDIFGTPKDTTSVSGSVFVASSEELSNFTTNKNNTTGSGVKAGKVSLSDFVKDYLRATGQGDYYFTRDLGDQLNTILCLNPVGDRSQAKAQQTLGVQFTVKVKEFACKSV